MSQKQRQDELMIKVEELKEKKAKKKIKKNRFENWLKTEKLLNTRHFKNYQKWDLYESSSDDDEKGEPIVPKDDPQFKAMEKDLNDRVKRQREENEKGNKLKNEGNEYLKQGKFREALEKYSEAIEVTKRMKVLYTNRALVYIKLEEYRLGLEDCEKVIEYYEIFEEFYYF
jgi:tetratricopeptide (TPR) repeat protein